MNNLDEGKQIVSLCDYAKLRRQAIRSPDNQWYTGEALGHDPKDSADPKDCELETHFEVHGGERDLRKKFAPQSIGLVVTHRADGSLEVKLP